MSRLRGVVGAITACCTVTLSLSGSAGATPRATSAHPSQLVGRRLPATVPPRVARRGSGVSSAASNWAGYAQAAPSKTYTAITGTLTVPTVNTSVTGDQFSSQWLGIGGFSDSTLVQAGVEVDNIAGNALYTAWTEIIPQAERPLRLSIGPGDSVTVSVIETSKNRWTMSVKDDTTGSSASRHVFYRSSGASVEAILERPCIQAPCDVVSDLADLAQTSPVTFDSVMAATSAPSYNPVYIPFFVAPVSATLEDIVMVDNSGSNVIATPSNANAQADGFTVADGSSVPSAPAG